MTDEKAAQTALVFVDNPTAPEIFADAAVGFHLLNGMVKITLGSVRASHDTRPGGANRLVIARLVMSVPVAQNLAVRLFEFLKSQGVKVTGTSNPTKVN
jgi:hypothetical protein